MLCVTRSAVLGGNTCPVAGLRGWIKWSRMMWYVMRLFYLIVWMKNRMKLGLVVNYIHTWSIWKCFRVGFFNSRSCGLKKGSWGRANILLDELIIHKSIPVQNNQTIDKYNCNQFSPHQPSFRIHQLYLSSIIKSYQVILVWPFRVEPFESCC